MVRMTAGMEVSEVIGEVAPQAGVQLLPWARTNASWKAFCPVASIIAAASGGLLSSGIRYDAEAYQLEPSPSVAAAFAGPDAVTAATPPASRPNTDSARARRGRRRRRVDGRRPGARSGGARPGQQPGIEPRLT
ncbi:hypothetical protein TR51_01220 [Kitasatospora griseola]|uniref:Uncharacterized protein n=1 Tax=Kitasatospora griseola TaxID=2064 RepID=A0A0D0NDM2_KITGR|nr:hypothetical protein TR51_01220 [Kitasatospora griseola]